MINSSSTVFVEKTMQRLTAAAKKNEVIYGKI